MGIHNSKENHQLKTSINENPTWQTSLIPSTITKKTFNHNKQTIYYGWQEIYRCSHHDWLHGISGRKIKKKHN